MRKRYVFVWAGAIVLLLALTSCSAFPVRISIEPVNPVQSTSADASSSSSEQGPVYQEDELPPLPEMAVGTEVSSRLVALYQRVNPSVVNIQVTRIIPNSGAQLPPSFPNIPGFPEAPDQPGNQYQVGQGSGFVYDSEGHIVTNYHVVGEADEVMVTFSDGLSLSAELVGGDPDSDLAVIKVESLPDRVAALPLGDSEGLRVGQAVAAIGNPFGLEGSMTTGIISALGRTLPSQARTLGGNRFSIPNVVQTDAAINPGNSGGPLLNLAGEVVGVNTAIESSSGQYSGVGFAVPSNTVERVVPVLIEEGGYRHPWLGISGMDLIPFVREAMDLGTDQRGVLVVTVIEDSPAEEAGLQGSDAEVQENGRTLRVGGDVIVGIDAVTVQDFDDLLSYLSEETQVDQEVELQVLRDGEQLNIPVTLGERPGESG